MPKRYIARLSCGTTNRKPIIIIDQARRASDQLGRLGIEAKRGQTNERFERRGSLSLAFPTRRLRERYIVLLGEWGDPALIVERRIRRRA